MVVAESGGGFVETQLDCGNAMMGFGVGNEEVEGYWGRLYTKSKLRPPSLSSRNTIGDTNRNSDKLKQNWVKLRWRKCMVGKVMPKWWWWLMKKRPSLSSLDTLGDSNHSSSNH